MNKIIAMIFCLVLALSLVGCRTRSTGDGSPIADGSDMQSNSAVVDTESHPSGFDGETLYINVNGEILVYERFEPGIGSLTKKDILDTFSTETEIEGIVWEVYSVEEYPDLSYVLVISGTNSSWTYHMI